MKTALTCLAVLVALLVTSTVSAGITRREWREIRGEAQDVRREVRQATSPNGLGGMLITRQERREIRGEERDLYREIRQAVRHY